MEKFLEELNEEQKKAAKTIDGPILILAGAGSGKTKTITSRLAFLLSIGIDPANTLTLTFTNKAANEMRERALKMIGNISYPPLLCTFHKFGLLFLKFHIDKIDRKNNFVVIDGDDKKRIIKNLGTELPVSLVASEISKYKNSLISPKTAIEKAIQPNYKIIASLYKSYEEYLAKNNLVDFDDLLSLTYKILDENPELCEQTSQRYKYIMIDEYQDTNELQYKIVKKLCSTHNNICVVGDDDQSIYGWRGANIKNILEFADKFENTKIIKLEKNYRSTKQILKVANDLIEHNRGRLGKKLESTKGDGKEVELIDSENETTEANIISNRVKKLIDKGVSPNEIAILYRINALSRSIEEGLNRNSIPYKMVGGVKFYERAEIKDLISYLRVIANPNDDFSFKRIINRPKRGIGKVTIDKVAKAAYDNKQSIHGFLSSNLDNMQSIIKSKKSLEEMKKFIKDLKRLSKSVQNSTYEFIDKLEETFHIKEYYYNLPDSIDKVANIDEFYGLFRDFVVSNPNASIDDFLNDITLQSDQDQIDNESISIMSIHASKGLEFDHLFVIGLEEGFFPITGEGSDIEEERRLGYVAMTRAKEELTLSCSSSRFYKGRRATLGKSRFLTECGICKGSLSLEKTTSFRKGDLVKHKIFGMGRVLEVNKIKREFKLHINFGGTKRDILASFVEKI
ncbi:MAG: UvrD-helicase domain-containing protein [Epsilonproteobacteria bacterium]|nr:UvrD-helicase domain-containing protein [Campylobacterota bacterium]